MSELRPGCELCKYTWGEVFKNEPSKIFKGHLPQILLGPFLNTLSHVKRIAMSKVI